MVALYAKPYLFVPVMTCIENDISREVTQQVKEARIPGAAFDMVSYADDTIVVSRTKEACEELQEKTKESHDNTG